MAPTPQECDLTRVNILATDSAEQDLPLDGDRIVISGLSGLYPQSHNVKELADILYNKENPMSLASLRWNYKHCDLAPTTGMAPDLDRFDAQFFAVHYRLGHYIDPMCRKLLEQAYQAIYDAGVSPARLNGKKVGVFMGASFSDTDSILSMETMSRNGLGLLGVSKTMFSNRISYWLNTNGPSMSIDESDCSSTSALEAAYSAMKRGECEAAIVGGAFVCLQPQVSIHHGRLSATISKDGNTKSFAQDADGYVLSDTISVIFLQKAKDANRVYAELLHVKNEFTSLPTNEMGPKFGYCRNPQTTAGFIKQFYKEVQVAPREVEYVEAYGTGLPDADRSELEALEEVYCKDRQDPLMIGSVTSNIGLTEAASGMAAITKILLGYHAGKLAANLHCSNPRQDVAALREGRMRVVTEHQPFRRSYVAVNGMSVTGVNSHVLLHGHYKPKDLSRYETSIPRLVTISGRKPSAITKIFEDFKSRPVDAEELALLHNIHANNISGHLGRGFIILDTDDDLNTVRLSEKCAYFDDARRPLWFVYSGMGSQWAGMGAQLMRIPIFAAAIERCHSVLEPEGLNLVHIITSPDKEILSNNILNAFVGIAAIQIGLTDIIHELGLKPDGIIGHSVGELGCAYADGCLTAEETIMCAYQRGRVSLSTPLIHGAMAAVGLGYKQISKLCPPSIDVACHNGPDSSTISGPADEMKKFVADLTAKSVFAKEVPTSNIAYHSRYIAAAGPQLLKLLKTVIKNPKPRSERWLSTSIPQKDWDEDLAKYCSAEYQTNNLLSSVFFEETSRLLPSNAVLVEIAPHGLLQAILRRSMSDCGHVPLTRRGHRDSALFLLEAIGDLYMHGYTPNVQALYPRVEFPVSTETPMLSHLVEWNHYETWYFVNFVGGQKRTAAACEFLKSIHDDEYSLLQGHVVREKRCYPFAAGLVAAWDTLAMHSGVAKRQGRVQFRDVHLYSQPTLHDLRPLRLSVALHRGCGKFEIMNENHKVASGYIQSEFKSELVKVKGDDIDMELSSQDIYQLLQDRDYNYSGEFISVEAASASLSQAALVWRDNWVTFLDGLLQMNMLRQPHGGVTLPTHVRRLDIDASQHLQEAYSLNGKTVVNAYSSDVYDITRCGGVALHNIKYRNLPPVTQDARRVELVGLASRIIGKDTSGSVQQHGDVKNAVTLQCSHIGNLDSLRWVDSPPLQRSDLVVTVHYAGLCTSDVKRATGVLPCDSNAYGMDYSGTTDSGERVMGVVRSGACGSEVRAQPELLWPVPAHWSLEDAATVPLAYVHALYCLKIKGRMLPGNTVLVHGGAGALGQAAIAIALAYGCTVFTTVSDLRKKHFLQKLYPEIKDEHIGNSRDSSFSDNVLIATKGKGCQVILSCVKGQFKTASLKCLGFSGTLVDTVQLQDAEEYELGMFFMTKQRSYVTSDLTYLFTEKKRDEMKYLRLMLSEGIARGYVRPLTRVSYSPHDAARAFRLLAGSRHRGKVMLRMHDCVLNADSRIICNPVSSHLMFWDDGALGVQLADKLVHSGAKKLYIHCTRLNQYMHYKIGNWRKFGVEVLIIEENAKHNIAAVINDANNLETIEGIYVAITKVSDVKHTEELTTLINSLDVASKSLCPYLKYFVVVSTVSSVGQDTCLARTRCGFTATYLDLSGLESQNKRKANAHEVAEAAERALCCTSPVLLAQPAHAPAPGLLHQLIALAEVIIPQDTDPDTTMQELGMEDAQVPIICAFLNNEYNIALEADAIPMLTIKKIHELVKFVTDIVPDNVSGLPLFFSAVAPDELLATIDIVVLPTLDVDNTLSSDEFDVCKRYLCIVPGMEGHHERFRVLCERLKLPALVLQPGFDHPTETVRETAYRYAQILINKTRVQNNFYLLGYESGVLVALELAAILEDHGLTGTVFCIGCTPDDLQEILEEQLCEFKTEEQLQDAVIRHMSKLLVGKDVAELDDVLRDGGTWSQKLDACIRVLLERIQHTAQYPRGVIESALASVERTRDYVVPAHALRSQLVLVRAATAHVTSSTQALQRHSQRTLAVHQLRTPLSFISNDMECPAIINRYLDTEMKSKFEMKNRCVAYTLEK